MSDDGYVSPLEDPVAANKAVADALESVKGGLPVIDLPPDDLVILPGGLKVGDDTYKSVVVQELTGVHEELLAKASNSRNPFHFIDTLIECGVVSIDGAPKSKTKEILKQLLVGDRDAIVLGIRRATYGNDIEIEGFECPQCGSATDLSIGLDEIEVSTLDDPDDANFTVQLRKNRVATVRLPNGEDQIKMFDNLKTTQAERDTILLSRVVDTLSEADGTVNSIAAFPSKIRDMGIPDRKKILREIVKRQVGPKYNEIKFTHEDCGEEVTLSLGVGDLFLDL